jgi:glycosyltransferase involved in cell wall biosynthesis
MSGGAAGPRKVRVLHLLWSGRIGGIEREVAAVARHAAVRRQGLHRVCFLDGRGVVGNALLAEGLADRLELSAGWDTGGLWRFARLLRRLQPDVVHSHTHALLPTLVVLAALRRVALVYTEQSPRVLASDRKFRLLYRLLHRSVTRFIALTPAMARAMEAYGVTPERVELVPNLFAIPRLGVEPPCHHPAVIGVVARLEEQKRVDLLVEIVAELRRRGVEVNGLIVGGGTREPALRRQTEQAGLTRVIEFAGEQDDVVPWLDRMDLFLMTSAAEPFGITALEAMARRVPVVAMPCPGGLSELVSRAGLLLPDRSIARAATSLAELLGAPERRRELRARGNALVAEHTPEQVFPRLEAVYARAAATRAGTNPPAASWIGKHSR